MENFIREDEIIIKCNIPTGKLKALSIREEMRAHTVAQITAEITPGSFQIAALELNSQPLMIVARQEGKERLLFWGVISEIHVEGAACHETVHMKAYSLSWFMDLEKKSRSYQGFHSVLEIMEKVGEEHSFKISCFTQDCKTEAPFIQYRESDWEFLVRLSTHLHVPMYPENSYSGKEICMGLSKSRRRAKLYALTEKWCMDEKRAQKMDSDAGKAFYYEVVTGDLFHVGEIAEYERHVLWVFQGEMELRKGMLVCTYRLSGNDYGTVETCFNPHIKGISLTGKVLERENETVGVHLDIDGESVSGSGYAYPWLPEHGNMTYCMPEPGSRIRLLITGEDERNAVGVHCVRPNGGRSREAQIPANRWFATDENKKLMLEPSRLMLSGEEGRSQISLKDDTGGSIGSSGNILIQAKGKVHIQGTKVALNAPQEITMVKRGWGDSAVVNICHNLDAMGKQTAFYNLEELTLQNAPGESRGHGEGQAMSKQMQAGEEEERKKRRFELQELMEQEEKESRYELGEAVLSVLSAVPQYMGKDKLSQIAAGFRPILGRMNGEKGKGGK